MPITRDEANRLLELYEQAARAERKQGESATFHNCVIADEAEQKFRRAVDALVEGR